VFASTEALPGNGILVRISVHHATTNVHRDVSFVSSFMGVVLYGNSTGLVVCGVVDGRTLPTASNISKSCMSTRKGKMPVE